MAMLWQRKEGGHLFWNLERCENAVVVYAYEQVRGNIPSERSMREFEQYFYINGVALKDHALKDINAERKRINLPLIEIRETFQTDYIKIPDRARYSQHRQQLRSEWHDAKPSERQQMFRIALAEQAAQGPPHTTFAEYQDRKKAQESKGLKLEEVWRRRDALNAINVAPPPPPTAAALTLQRAMDMLSLSDNERVQDQIIAKLDIESRLAVLTELLPNMNDDRRSNHIRGLRGEQAYQIAQRLKSHPVVVDALLLHALEHM